jgi:hypothetical protein
MWRTIYHELRRWAKATGLVWASYKRTEITVETDRVWVIRKSHTQRAWRGQCGRVANMVGPQEAEAMLGNTPPMTVQAIKPSGSGEDSRGWHWTQAADGSPLVCLESLLKSNSG